MSAKNPGLDVIIIGAGPAGLSAGIWCRDLGLTAVVLEKEDEPGGQLLSIYNPIANYPGLRTEIGRELRDRFLETAVSVGVDIRLGTEVVDIDQEQTRVIIADGQRFTARSIILATGVRRRRLNIPGETEFAGRGILASGARDREAVRGKVVAIIGGGDAAFENAVILSEYADKVYVIHRRDSFSARDEFVEQAAAIPSVEIITKTVISRINGSDSVESVELSDQNTKENRTLRVDNILIRIGVEPNSELITNTAHLDSHRYLLADAAAPGIYAIGDVANPDSPTICTAVGTGASTAKRLRSRVQ